MGPVEPIAPGAELYPVATGEATRIGWRARVLSAGELALMVLALGVAAALLLGLTFLVLAVIVSAALN